MNPVRIEISQESMDIDTSPELDLCRCDTCRKEMSPTEAINDYGCHNGWEYPPYNIQLCPYCEDGYIDDYYPSEKSLARYIDSLDSEQREHFLHGREDVQ